MWVQLTSRDQLQVGSRLKQTILEGNGQLITIYEVISMMNIVMMIKIVETQGYHFDITTSGAFPRGIQAVINEGYQIWQD